ncbi:hypothetical protein [Duganella callida]|uniref:Uncharacterized protein n=1 Tax=Duganella callida TaxID=2561932 RepID=A0A4Y9SFT1_9BURK|nr:hypothetical protein [Duganella callida]TFW19827.1 hypothetical protein E4L98_15730 [Duganella callida]
MKMTIVTDAHGNVLGAVQGHNLSENKDGVEATVSFAPGHSCHMVEVDDDLTTVDDVDEFQQRLRRHLQQHQQQP